MAGTTQVSLLGALAWQEETSFAANVSTFNKALRVRDAVLDLSGIVQAIIPRGGVFNRPNQGDFHIPGPFEAPTLTFTMDLYGHGAVTTAGALAQTPLARLLGNAIGNATADAIGGDLTAGAHSATDFVSTNVTATNGDIFRIGALGDGRAEGQMVVVDSQAGTTFTSSMAMPGTPDDGESDKAFAMQMIYPEDALASMHLTSDGSTSNNTLRFIVTTGNQQWVLTGCALTTIAFNGLNTAELPSVTFTFTAAYWADIDIAFPVVASVPADFAPAPTAAGSFFIQDEATTTRVTDKIRNFGLTIEHQMLPTIGSETANENQTITGWVRGMSRPTITFDVEAQDATAAPTWSAFWNTDPNDAVFKHVGYLLNPTDGRAVAFSFPRMRISGDRPTQNDLEGMAYVTVNFEGVEGDRSVTDTTLFGAAWRLALG
jgi:hypothetical protein